MSRFLRNAACAALAVAAASAVAGAASAQSYSRLVVFGDSLSDNGNLFNATGGTQPPAPIYWQGRFATGPVWTELLGFNTARVGGAVTGSINYAYGGARTDSAASPPGMRNQLLMYMGGGGTFGSNDLVSILGGANNIFQGLPIAGATANPAGAIQPVSLAAAADINFLVDSVAAAGAGTILVTNLPKLSLTPQFRNTTAAPLADYAVGAFNGALLTGLNGIAAARPNTNIIMMDLFKIGDVIAGNPQAFGISNVTDACFNGVSLCSNPGGYFYLDGVHPTALGHQLIARLATDYLYYGDLGAQTALQGETAWRHREEGLEAATAALSGRGPWAAGTAMTFGAIIDRTETDARGVVASSRSDGHGLRLGLESGPSDTMRFGLAGSYRKAEVDGGGHAFDLQTMALDVYAGWRSQGAFLTAAAGVAHDNFEQIDRLTALQPVVHTASTDGASYGARLQGGFWFGGDGGLAISPRAAVTWASSDIDGYYEQGPAAQYEYGDRTVSGVTAEASLRAEGMIGAFDFHLEGGYRDVLDDSSDAVRVGIQGNPARVLGRSVDHPFGGQFLASAGIEGDWGPARISFGYRGRFGDHADSHMGAINIRLPL